MRSVDPAITVIVPTYNVSKYITFCIDSILSQTFQDFELIIVDDVSSDDTYDICQRLYSHLEGVTVLRNPVNKGQWYARNMGILKGKGKYIYFMDNDDELLPKALETLYQKAEEEQADVVHANLWAQVYTDDRMVTREFLWKPYACHDVGEGMLKGSPAEKLFYQGSASMPMPWMNLYRRDFLAKEGIEFPEMVFGEDTVFSIEVTLKAERYFCINNLLYLYRCYYDQKGKMTRRFPKAIPYIPIFMESWNRIFAAFTEEEISFDDRRNFITGWIMAHLGFCVYDIMNTDDKESFNAVKESLRNISSESYEFTAYLINVIQHANNKLNNVMAEREDKIRKASNFFAELENGKSEYVRNHSRIYCEAKLSTYMEGADDKFYCRVYSLLGDASLELGKYQEAVEAYNKSMSYARPRTDEFFRAAGKRLVARHYLDCKEEELAREYILYAKSLADIVPYESNRHEGVQRKKKIRLGVLSPYFCEHDVFFVNYGLLFCYDKDQFEVFCYHCGRSDDGYTAAVREQVDKFAYVAQLSYQERAEVIHRDGIDILIDMGGRHLEETVPVFAYRPAAWHIAGTERLPLALNGLIDYCVVDGVTMQKENNRMMAGKFLSLPCACSYAMQSEAEPSKCTPAAVNGAVTFGAIVHYREITDDMLVLWREIMEKVPNSVLLVKADEFAEKAMMVEAMDRFMDAGFDANRVYLKGTSKGYLQDYRDIDIFLSTYPVQDIARILNSLYMGVPPVVLGSLRSDNRLSRSIMEKVGLSDLAVSTKKAYVEKTVELSSNFERLDVLHKNIRSRLKVVASLNPATYTKKLEMEMRRIIMR